jgi:tRNA G18 (ribose-2'-O)-methylase SpoU
MPFLHVRHRDPSPLDLPREIVVAMPAMHSHVNLSRIVRMAGCCGVRRVIACGRPKVDREIARDAADYVTLEVHRTLPPVLKKLKAEGYTLVGLEQATESESLHTFAFPRRTALIVGHERNGLSEEELSLMDRVVEIPVWGQPASYNAATAATMALYEYCKQWPRG